MLRNGHVPPGVTVPTAAITADPGWLFCFGQALSRTTYVALFNAVTAVITGSLNSTTTVSSVSADLTQFGLVGAKVEGTGIPANTTIAAITSNSITLSAAATATASGVSIRILPHGNGDGSTTFNVPDMRSRGASGRDNMGGTAASRLTTAGSGINGAALGASGGSETHTLTTAQMPQHNHAVTDPGHAHSFVSGLAWTNGGPQTWGGGSAGNIGVQNMNSASTGISIQNNGSNGAHNNAQPTAILNFIIKT